MIDVVNDAEGVQIALEEIFEEDFVRARVDRDSKNASEESRVRLEATIPPRTLSPGYYEYGLHLLRLDSEQKAGIGFSASSLAAFEARGLVALGRARVGFQSRHPACGGCGTLQQNRFNKKCDNCGIKFQRKE